jgi:hypothetical protein
LSPAHPSRAVVFPGRQGLRRRDRRGENVPGAPREIYPQQGDKFTVQER